MTSGIFNAGEMIIEQDRGTNLLCFLVEASVEIAKEGVCVAAAAFSDPNAVGLKAA
jgi:hypothetical protein